MSHAGNPVPTSSQREFPLTVVPDPTYEFRDIRQVPSGNLLLMVFAPFPFGWWRPRLPVTKLIFKILRPLAIILFGMSSFCWDCHGSSLNQ